MSKRIFTEAEQAFIRENYLLLSGNDIGKHIKCDGGVVLRYLRNEGLVVPREVTIRLKAAKQYGRTNITAEEDAFMREHYLDMSYGSIGKVLGRADSVIKNRIERLGLIIPEEIIQQRVLDSRLKKGNVSFNKGKKQTDYMDAEAIARTAKTRFKKGNAPMQTHPDGDGAISIRQKKGERPYKFIRVSLGHWKLLQIVNWEKINRPVPKGHCLWCRNEDTMNCDPDNWELITRKENRLRNTGWNKLDDHYIATTMSVRQPELRKELMNHPDLLELKRQEFLLTRAIKQQENGRKERTGQ